MTIGRVRLLMQWWLDSPLLLTIANRSACNWPIYYGENRWRPLPKDCRKNWVGQMPWPCFLQLLLASHRFLLALSTVLASRNSWQPLILQVFMVNIELHRGSPNSWKGSQNHNENGDPGSPFSWGPQNFMTPGLQACRGLTLFALYLPGTRVDYFLFIFIPRHTIIWV